MRSTVRSDAGRRAIGIRHVAYAIWMLVQPVTLAEAQVRITELMAVNDTGLMDEDGEYSDWLELFNAGATAIDLDGWYLTDDPDDLARWRLPTLSLPAGGFQVVFASGKDRSVAVAELHTNFRLSSGGEYLALVRADAATVEHEYVPSFPAQTSDVSYGLASDLTTTRCFLVPTPGAANDETLACGRADEPELDVERGFYAAPFTVTMTAATPGAEIYYTLDGSDPTTAGGTLYAAPLSISTTTVLRAAVQAVGLEPSRTVTHSYVFPEDVALQTGTGLPQTWAADYEMDARVVTDPRYASTIVDDLLSLPSISLAMDPDDWFGESDGIYSHPGRRGDEWERPVSAELLFPDGQEGFQVDCGTRIQGLLSRELNRKKSLRLAFKSIYGPSELAYPLFGPSSVRRFDKIRLRAGSERSFSSGSKRATYVRDQWVRDTQLAMGQLSSRGTFVHLYLNGFYWGLYNAVEKPDEDFAASHLGGDENEWDVLKHPFEVAAGSRDAWDTARALADAGLESPAAYAMFQQYVDVPNLIDYFLANLYAGTTDWDGNNWYAARRRLPGEGFRFFSWDAEQSMASVKTNRTGIGNSNRPSTFYKALRQNEEFRVLFGDHAHRHLFADGALTAERAGERFMDRIAEIDRAIVAESARWGDAFNGDPLTRDDDWLVEVEWLRLVFFPQRGAILLDQLRKADLYPDVAAPSLSENGGFVAADLVVSIAPAPAQPGTIYYTLDGADPRLGGGAIAPSAVEYGGPIPGVAGSILRARTWDAGAWSALVEARYVVDVPIRIGELMYHPADPPAPSAFADDDFEYVELVNTGSAPIDMAGMAFVDGIAFTFPSGALAAGARGLVVSNLAAFEARYGTALPVIGQYTGRLDNAGESVRLVAADGSEIVALTYDDGWYSSSDGTGRSLVAADLATPRSAWSQAAGWRASTLDGGSPGTAETPMCANGIDDDGDGAIDYPADPGCADPQQDDESPECDDGLDNDGDSLIDQNDPHCGARSGPREASSPVDLFACYRSRASASGARFEPIEATLTDALDASIPFTINEPRALCVPAVRGDALVHDPNVGLESYSIRETRTADRHTPRVGLLTRGLGPVFLDTIRSDRLLVPATVDETTAVVAPDDLAHAVDAFKCYRARTTKGAPSYFPRGVQLDFSDRFETVAYKIVRPTALCTSTAIDGSGTKDAARELVCYKAKPAKGKARHVPRTGVYVADRFGDLRVDTQRIDQICVPSD